MKRLIAGGLALGLAGVGGALLASPGGAQEPEFDFIEQLDASLTPTVVQAGQTVTVSSVDPCPQPPEVESHVSEVAWAYGAAGWLNPNDPSDQPGEIVDEGTTPVGEDGTWEFTFPATDAPGAYEVFAICVPDLMEDEMDEGLDPGAVEDLAAEAAAAAETLGGDHGSSTSSSSSIPDVSSSSSSSSTTPSTAPPEVEEGIFLYGPLGFTVGGAPAPARPIPQQPNFTG